MIRRLGAGAVDCALPVALVTIWWLSSANTDSFYFPPLRRILAAFAQTWVFERLGDDILPSLGRMAAGFGLAVVTGIGGGVVLGQSQVARQVLGPIVELLRAIPPPVLLPAGILVLGVGDRMKVVLIAVACVWPIMLSAIDGVSQVETTLLDTASSYGVRPADRLRYVVVPAALPRILAGMRTSLSISLIMMVVSEMVAGTNGIGFFILRSERSFSVAEMWSGVLLLGLLGCTLNYGFTVVERRVLRWQGTEPGPR